MVSLSLEDAADASGRIETRIGSWPAVHRAMAADAKSWYLVDADITPTSIAYEAMTVTKANLETTHYASAVSSLDPVSGQWTLTAFDGHTTTVSELATSNASSPSISPSQCYEAFYECNAVDATAGGLIATVGCGVVVASSLIDGPVGLAAGIICGTIGVTLFAAIGLSGFNCQNAFETCYNQQVAVSSWSASCPDYFYCQFDVDAAKSGYMDEVGGDIEYHHLRCETGECFDGLETQFASFRPPPPTYSAANYNVYGLNFQVQPQDDFENCATSVEANPGWTHWSDGSYVYANTESEKDQSPGC